MTELISSDIISACIDSSLSSIMNFKIAYPIFMLDNGISFFLIESGYGINQFRIILLLIL